MEIDKVVDKHNHNKQHQQQQQQSPQTKRQIRRRLHTNKPYQERLLNMAEARREITTALKFHRASMKQQQQATCNYDPQTQPPQEQEWKSNHFGPPLGLSHPHHWPISTIVPPPPPLNNNDTLNLVLPNQTLGLNLNYHDFNSLNTRIYCNPEPVCSSSSASSSYSNSSSSSKEAPTVEFLGVTENGLLGVEKDRKCANSHDDDDHHHHHPFEQVMEFPPWLINANESSGLQYIFDHNYAHDYSPDPALSCMDIGEIEGIDGEWLA